MPNKIDDFVPWRIHKFIRARLDLISPAMGYNTAPFITDDFSAFENGSAKHRLFFEFPGIEVPVQGIGDNNTAEPVIAADIVGYSRFETEHPRRLSMMLEQDVRASIHSGMSETRTSIGRGCSLSFGSCIYDGGALAPHKEVGFRLTVNFTWSQRSGW